MKRQVCIIFLLLIMIFPTVSFAAETSSDTMILEWKTYKVWKDGENLCMSGEFENLRNDLKTQETESLILDEPTNHLDIKYQLQIMDIVKSLNLTVIAAIHDLNIAAMYCDRLVALKDGQIVGAGKPKDLLTEKFIKDLYEVDTKIEALPNDNINIRFLPKHFK